MLLLSVFLSITGLARLILIILIGYLIYSIFIRVVVPAAITNFVRKNYPGFGQPDASTEKRKPVGDISIHEVDANKSGKSNSDQGEYVEFEEID